MLKYFYIGKVKYGKFWEASEGENTRIEDHFDEGSKDCGRFLQEGLVQDEEHEELKYFFFMFFNLRSFDFIFMSLGVYFGLICKLGSWKHRNLKRLLIYFFCSV